MLFEDDDLEGAAAPRAPPVQPARTSEQARRKRSTADGPLVHSLPTLLEDPATLTLNTVHLPDNAANRFNVATQPTPHSDAPSNCSTSTR